MFLESIKMSYQFDAITGKTPLRNGEETNIKIKSFTLMRIELRKEELKKLDQSLEEATLSSVDQQTHSEAVHSPDVCCSDNQF